MEQSALFSAAEKGDLDTFTRLLPTGSVDLTDDKGKSLLFVAAEHGALNIVEHLIPKGQLKGSCRNY